VARSYNPVTPPVGSGHARDIQLLTHPSLLLTPRLPTQHIQRPRLLCIGDHCTSCAWMRFDHL